MQTVKGSDVFEMANKAVGDMGDIFFEPDQSFGEYSIPANTATNCVSAAIAEALMRAGVIVEGDIPQLAESTDPNEEDAA